MGDPPSHSLRSALQHVGFGCTEPAAWFERASARGIEADTRGETRFSTTTTPTVEGDAAILSVALGAPVPACFTLPDQLAYVYLVGPDQERVELWSGSDARINHLHFTTPDLPATMPFYQAFLGVEAVQASLPNGSSFLLDGFLFFFEELGEASDYEDTESHVLAHLGGQLRCWRPGDHAQTNRAWNSFETSKRPTAL